MRRAPWLLCNPVSVSNYNIIPIKVFVSFGQLLYTVTSALKASTFRLALVDETVTSMALNCIVALRMRHKVPHWMEENPMASKRSYTYLASAVHIKQVGDFLLPLYCHLERLIEMSVFLIITCSKSFHSMM